MLSQVELIIDTEYLNILFTLCLPMIPTLTGVYKEHSLVLFKARFLYAENTIPRFNSKRSSKKT